MDDYPDDLYIDPALARTNLLRLLTNPPPPKPPANFESRVIKEGLEFSELLGLQNDRMKLLIEWLQGSESRKTLKRIDLSLNYLKRPEIEALLKVLPDLCPNLELLDISHSTGEWKDRRAIQRCFGELLGRPNFKFLVVVGSDISEMSDSFCKIPRYQKLIFSRFWRSGLFGAAPSEKHAELREAHQAHDDYLEALSKV